MASVKSDFNAEPFNEIEKQTIIDAAHGQIKILYSLVFGQGLGLAN